MQIIHGSDDNTDTVHTGNERYREGRGARDVQDVQEGRDAREGRDERERRAERNVGEAGERGETREGARRRDSVPALAGAAASVGLVGAALALADVDSALRAPFTLFFLLAAPASGIAVALPGVDPLTRSAVAVVGAAALNLLVAQAMITARLWSMRGGVVTVGALSVLLLLAPAVARTARRVSAPPPSPRAHRVPPPPAPPPPAPPPRARRPAPGERRPTGGVRPAVQREG
ncbi:hypothetical protein [Streptomyces sp. AJS327]|uniref:hypothetical protein n=1 Tax=Streptomyces sp. AJS327 TaxID=2545265 RepID=UPI0015DFCB95|nr:hypothetical protein [Streptomyces sp. AJS327]